MYLWTGGGNKRPVTCHCVVGIACCVVSVADAGDGTGMGGCRGHTDRAERKKCVRVREGGGRGGERGTTTTCFV